MEERGEHSRASPAHQPDLRDTASLDRDLSDVTSTGGRGDNPLPRPRPLESVPGT